MADSNLKINLDDFADGINSFDERLRAAIKMYAVTRAPELAAYMKANRKWTDRTGMAKARLSAEVSEPDENTVRITLAHGVDYGIWLELANEKNYAIIQPTLQQKSPEVLQGLESLMNKVKL